VSLQDNIQKRFPAAHSQPLCLVLCKAAANCGAPQLVQQFVGFKYMISLYLLLKNNLMAPELLSNFSAEFRLINISLLRNLKIIQQLDSLLSAKKNMIHRSGLKCFVGMWLRVTGKLNQMLPRLHLLGGEMSSARCLHLSVHSAEVYLP